VALPLRSLEGPVAALFSDLDGTLTTAGRLEAATVASLEALDAAGVPLIAVTGRPAGWAQALLSLAPFRAAIAENGGVTFARRGDRIVRTSPLAGAELAGWRARMHAEVAAIAAAIPGARLSADSPFREVDLAIDWNEEAELGAQAAEQIVARLRAAGLTAVRSSVHVNFAPPGFDKLTACRALVGDLLGGDPDRLDAYVYVGDALNDAPMFAGFPRSVGVANVRAVWDELDHRPAYVCDAGEGAGFRELAARVLELNR